MPDDLTKIAKRLQKEESKPLGTNEGINFFSGFEQKPFQVQDVPAIQESTRQPLFETEEEPRELSRVEQTIKSVFDRSATGIDNVLEGKATLGAIDLATSILELRFLPFTVPLAFFGDVSQAAGEQIGGQTGETVQAPSKVLDWLFSLPAQGFRGAVDLGLQGLEEAGVDTDKLKNDVVLLLKAKGTLAPEVDPQVFWDKLGDLGDIVATLGVLKGIRVGGKAIKRTLTKKKTPTDIKLEEIETTPVKGVTQEKLPLDIAGEKLTVKDVGLDKLTDLKETKDGITRTQPKAKGKDKGTKEDVKIETKAETKEEVIAKVEKEGLVVDGNEISIRKVGGKEIKVVSISSPDRFVTKEVLLSKLDEGIKAVKKDFAERKPGRILKPTTKQELSEAFEKTKKEGIKDAEVKKQEAGGITPIKEQPVKPETKGEVKKGITQREDKGKEVKESESFIYKGEKNDFKEEKVFVSESVDKLLKEFPEPKNKAEESVLFPDRIGRDIEFQIGDFKVKLENPTYKTLLQIKKNTKKSFKKIALEDLNLIAPRVIERGVSPKGKIDIDAVNQAKVNIINKTLGRTNLGFDPTLIKDFAVIGAHHFARGVKKFAEWSEVMRSELGKKINPFLLRIWDTVKKEVGKKIVQIVESPFFPIKQTKIVQGELFGKGRIPKREEVKIEKFRSENVFKNSIKASEVKGANIPNVATRTTGKGKKVPVIRKSGFFATKEIEKAPIKNVDKILMAPNNMALFQDGFKLGGEFGVVYKKMWLPVKAMVTNNISMTRDYVKTLKDILKEHNFKITKKNGELLSDMLEKKVPIPEKYKGLTEDIRTFLDRLRDDSNIIRERMGKKEIGFIENYVSHMRKTALWNDFIDNIATITNNFDFVIPNEAKNPFAYKRYLKELPNSERNFFHISDRYINAISKDINITPAIEYLKAYNSVLKNRELFQASKYWDRYIREGLLGKQSSIDAAFKVSVGVRKGLRKFKDILNKAFLTGKIAWNIATQPLSFIGLTQVDAGIRNTIVAVGKMFNKGVRAEVRRNSLSLKIKSGDVLSLAVGEGRNFGNRVYRTKIDKWNDAISMFSAIEEQLLHQASYVAGLSRAKQLGYKGQDAIDYADLVAERTQSMYNRENRAPILNSDILTATSPFQSFSVEIFNHLREATGTGGAISLNARQRFGKIFRLATGIYLANLYSEAITGRKKTTVGTFFPFVGSIIDQVIDPGSGRSPVALVQQVEEVIKAAKDYLNHGDLRRFRKFGITFGTAFFGAGGGSQLNNIIDGIQADINEEVKSVSGNKLFDVKDIGSKIKAPIFGIWSTRGGINYWKLRSGKSTRKGTIKRDVIKRDVLKREAITR